MLDQAEPTKDRKAPAGQGRTSRVLTLVVDAASCALLVGLVVTIVVSMASPWLPVTGRVFLGVTVGVFASAAVPAVLALHLSPPLVPLTQRSAFFSSAAWFGRTVGAGAIFALSIVLGAVAGVVASRVSENQHDLGRALGTSFAAVAQLALWPIVLVVVAIAYVIMSVRWLFDLTRIVDDGGALRIGLALERRWFGPRVLTSAQIGARDLVALVLVSYLGRLALVLALVTIAVTVLLVSVATLQRIL